MIPERVQKATALYRDSAISENYLHVGILLDQYATETEFAQADYRKGNLNGAKIQLENAQTILDELRGYISEDRIGRHYSSLVSLFQEDLDSIMGEMSGLQEKQAA